MALGGRATPRHEYVSPTPIHVTLRRYTYTQGKVQVDPPQVNRSARESGPPPLIITERKCLCTHTTSTNKFTRDTPGATRHRRVHSLPLHRRRRPRGIAAPCGSTLLLRRPSPGRPFCRSTRPPAPPRIRPVCLQRYSARPLGNVLARPLSNGVATASVA